MTPKFDDTDEPMKWPLLCSLEVTLDGKNYIECEE